MALTVDLDDDETALVSVQHFSTQALVPLNNLNFILHDMNFACFLGRTRGKTCRKSGRKPSWVGQVSLNPDGIVSSLSGWYLALAS